MDELAFTIAKLTKCGVDLSIKEEMTLMTTSYTQSKFEIHQPLKEEEMSIQELVAKHMNEGESMVETSFKGQQKNVPSNLEAIKEEDLSYNEDITLRNNEELEKLQRVENDAQYLKALVVTEDESTSSESHEKIQVEVVKNIPEMAPWGEMYEDFDIVKVTPMSKVEECIV